MYTWVFNLPLEFVEHTWSNVPTVIDPCTWQPCVLVDTEHLVKLRSFIARNPLTATAPTLIWAGSFLHQEEQVLKIFQQDREQHKMKGKIDGPKIEVTDEIRLRYKLGRAQLARIGMSKSKETLHRLQPPSARMLENWPLAGVLWQHNFHQAQLDLE